MIGKPLNDHRKALKKHMFVCQRVQNYYNPAWCKMQNILFIKDEDGYLPNQYLSKAQ